MTHWAEKYIGAKWTHEHDCYWWFREIQKNEFGRDVADVPRWGDLALFAARHLTDGAVKRHGWRKTETPREGDAVMMSMRNVPTHIGTITVIARRQHVVHVIEGIGGMVSSLINMKTMLWNIASFWTPDENQ